MATRESSGPNGVEEAGRSGGRHEQTAGSADSPAASRRVVYPVGEIEQPEGVATVARALAGAESRPLVTGVVSVPEQTPLELSDRVLGPHREQLRYAAADVAAAGPGPVPDTRQVVGRHTLRSLANTVERHDATTVVTSPPQHRPPLTSLRRSSVEWLQTALPTRVVVVRDAPEVGSVSSILLPVPAVESNPGESDAAAGPASASDANRESPEHTRHVSAAVETARRLAVARDAWVDLLHVVPSDASEARRERGRAALAAAREQCGGLERCDTWDLTADNVAAAVAEQSVYYDATVIGTPRHGRLERLLGAATATEIAERAHGTTLVVSPSVDDE
jgi:nucleotide-binding universal stress UspA family protein